MPELPDINFREALTVENRTLTWALTNPRIVRGIGNAYSDEILHAAQLSPVSLTGKLNPQEWQRLYAVFAAKPGGNCSPIAHCLVC